MKGRRLYHRSRLKALADQRGIVSTYVSMGIVSIMSLIAISFASIMQSEYTQARDRQFNTQARYAAETAINDARQEIYRAIQLRLNADSVHGDLLQEPYDTINIETWFDCGDTSGGSTVNRGGNFEGGLDAPGSTSNIEYTCVEVDGRPVKLVYDDVNIHRSQNILLQTRWLEPSTNHFKQSNIDKLIINWGSEGGGDNFQPGNNHNQQLPDTLAGGWSYSAPMLKIQLIPLNLRDGWKREDLNQWSRTYFLYPTRGITQTPNVTDPDAQINLYSGTIDDDGSIINADCDGNDVAREHACLVEISGFNNGFIDPPDYGINNARDNIGNYTDQYPKCDTDASGDAVASTCQPALASPLPPGVPTPPCTSSDPHSTCVVESHPAIANGTNDEIAYIVLIRPIYGAAKIEIGALNSNAICSPQPKCRELRFINQQINVTSTGRAGGLTYRLREVIPIRPKYNRPEYAIDSASHICKTLIGEPDTGVSYDYNLITQSSHYKNSVGTFPTTDAEQFCEELHP